MNAQDAAGDRFEVLLGRFFDDVLSAAEDAELAGLLRAQPALGERFLRHARMERLLAGLCGAQRLGQEEFNGAVVRGIELLANEQENRRFAAQVVELLQNRRSARRTRRFAGRLRRGGMARWAAAGALAACVALALLLALRQVSAPAPLAAGPAQPVAPAPAPLRPPGQAPLAETAPTLSLPEFPPGGLVLQDSGAPDMAPAGPADPAEPPGLAETPLPVVPAPAPRGVEPGPRHAEPSQGRLAQMYHANCVWVRTGAPAESPALAGDAAGEGDLLRVAAAPFEQTDEARGAEVTLREGSTLWLAPGTELVFHAEGEQPLPVLRQGALTARITKKLPDYPLKIRTAQGPEIEVVGTVFRVYAEPKAKRVEVSVEEGKVTFRGQGGERKLLAGEACEALDGQPPATVWTYRAPAAVLAGLVMDKAGEKPVAGAKVSAIPSARAPCDEKWPSTRTDAQGRFHFAALPEGPYFIAVAAKGGGGFLSERVSVVRVRLQAGENAAVTVTLDRAALVAGNITDPAGKALADCRVRFTGPNGDGQTWAPELANLIIPPNEYRFVAVEGSGRYTVIVEKPGLAARLRGPRTVQLLNDRMTVFSVEAQFVPSAVVKGRVSDAKTGRALACDPGLGVPDPLLPPAYITLTPAAGLARTLVPGPDGRFLFDTNLEAGYYELKVQRYGYATLARPLTLAAGQTVELDLSVEPTRRRQ